jgi:hypothetical protein
VCFQSNYSMTSSVRARKLEATVRPSALAVLRLRTNLNLVACSIGMSPGFAPLIILSTKAAARRNKSAKITP